MYGLKPVPFEPESFSAACKGNLFRQSLIAGLESARLSRLTAVSLLIRRSTTPPLILMVELVMAHKVFNIAANASVGFCSGNGILLTE